MLFKLFFLFMLMMQDLDVCAAKADDRMLSAFGVHEHHGLQDGLDSNHFECSFEFDYPPKDQDFWRFQASMPDSSQDVSMDREHQNLMSNALNCIETRQQVPLVVPEPMIDETDQEVAFYARKNKKRGVKVALFDAAHCSGFWYSSIMERKSGNKEVDQGEIDRFNASVDLLISYSWKLGIRTHTHFIPPKIKEV